MLLLNMKKRAKFGGTLEVAFLLPGMIEDSSSFIAYRNHTFSLSMHYSHKTDIKDYIQFTASNLT